MKAARHAKILELISAFQIETQEELLLALRDAGFAVTQATISRDIKELQLVKQMGKNGRYCYTAGASAGAGEPARDLQSIFSHAILKVDYAGNTVVIKCRSGMAQAACAALDSRQIEGVVGTLAGEDTIFVLVRNETQAAAFTRYLAEPDMR